MKLSRLMLLASMTYAVIGQTNGAKSDTPDSVPRIPARGVTVSAGDKVILEAGIATLGKEIEALKTELKSKPDLLELLPDVQIYYNAARYALTYDEFFNVREIETAKKLLEQGQERATDLRQGKTPWTTQTGTIARGYLSEIDGSVQPYGVIVPATYGGKGDTKPRRLDFWFHGRGEQLSELNFINERQHSMGEFAPADTFVLHPYGRYCNANRFAGEIDGFEAMQHLRKHYPVDPDRIAVRGFSMGGAACWTFATHYAGLWAAANPGAGFSETAGFLRIGENDNPPTWYERKLWHLYDSTDYALNLYNLPTIAYSGEVDGQRQAAVEMTKSMTSEGLELTHIIGAKAGHWYEQNAKKDVAARVDALVAQGNDRAPKSVKLTTWTLKYNEMKWLTIDAMGKEWERARVDADLQSDHTLLIKAQNVIALTINPPSTPDWKGLRKVTLDGQTLNVKPGTIHLRKTAEKWSVVRTAEESKLAKRHNLQGPIDDAFMSAFVMIRPTGKAMNPLVGAWAETEMQHATEHWRRQFRGEAPVKNDTELTSADIAGKNLILWGDPSSNAVLAKIAGKLPIRWDAKGIHVDGKTYDSATNVPVLIYPNPLNPKRYIVINSGFTFREYDYLNNARQTPKLPDWAVVDIASPPTSRTPGKIVEADFFGEHWELMKSAAH